MTTLMMMCSLLDLCFSLAPFALAISLTFRALRSFRNLYGTVGRDWTAERSPGRSDAGARETTDELGRDERVEREGKEGCYHRILERTLARYERR